MDDRLGPLARVILTLVGLGALLALALMPDHTTTTSEPIPEKDEAGCWEDERTIETDVGLVCLPKSGPTIGEAEVPDTLASRAEESCMSF